MINKTAQKTIRKLIELALKKYGNLVIKNEPYTDLSIEVQKDYVSKGVHRVFLSHTSELNGDLYKSGKALKLVLGTYTKICSNGAVLGTKDIGDAFKHCKSVEFTDQKSGLFMNEIQHFISGFAGHLEYLEKIKQIEMTKEMIESFKLKFSEKDCNFILSMWERRKGPHVNANRVGDSVHDFYQTATEYFSHGFKSGANLEDNKIIRLTLVQKTIDSFLKVA